MPDHLFFPTANCKGCEKLKFKGFLLVILLKEITSPGTYPIARNKPILSITKNLLFLNEKVTLILFDVTLMKNVFSYTKCPGYTNIDEKELRGIVTDMVD